MMVTVSKVGKTLCEICNGLFYPCALPEVSSEVKKQTLKTKSSTIQAWSQVNRIPFVTLCSSCASVILIQMYEMAFYSTT